ncbi:PLDc N-terminal domain-containing protein [Cellulomonas shaoxiangyii]|uniref:Cardiolipin synthase N-terminal domain-containing protein n=1 Tax=Cellulomonas shaoxiangyii TaxID=2566013 RepID=A0A4P7SGR7_9CELL|nr:PLDc N-terminal domain-containing protein [Cellulomonas shaoxiangyii]QCB92838.1 hypothetical protein E5225_04005 [Cellulomonas shaoxiangyii]TGY85515.1 hypothetical protein E5226_06205 [Cellulomonas shaoxiangyii]
MLRYLLLLVAVGLAVYCVIDVLRSDERTRRGLPALLWLAVVVLVPVVGALTWLLLRRAGDGAGPGPRSRPSRPVAPDDDPDFLRRLDEERRRRQREAGGHADADGADGGTGGGDPTPT